MEQLYVATLSVLLVLLISIIWYIRISQKRGGKLPPGPRGLPILGYLPFLDKNLLHQFTDLSRKYGPIFKINLGNKPCVVISSPSLVKEVVRDKDVLFARRDIPLAAFIVTYGANDIAWSPPNSQWRAMRKIFAQEMLSNKCLDASYNLRRDEVRKAIRHVHAKTGEPIEIGQLSFQTELNVVMSMLWGGTPEGEEGKRFGSEFRVIISKIVDLTGKPNISDFYPFLAWLDIQGIKKQTERYVKSLDDIFDAVIAEHKQKLNSGTVENEGKKDFLQILLELQQKQDDSEKSISLRQIKAILVDIVVGGTDTTATTVEWPMAELINNPEVMAKAQKELSEVVGLNNIIEEFHMPKFKYLEAVVKETLRLYPAVPLLVPRSPAESSTVGGYTLTNTTRVFINAWAIHRDPSFWDDPTKFEPERFLDENHEKWDFSYHYHYHYHYIPFGSGRRICAGLPLAERMVVYLLASLLHSFDWKLPEGETLDMEGTFGIVFRKTTPLFAIPIARLPNSSLYV